MNQQVNWTRFWAPTGSKVNLTPEGFLLDPASSDFWEQQAGHVFSFAQLAGKGCLVLLGAAGIGKTTEAKSAYEEIHARSVKDGDVAAIWVDLRACDGSAWLREKLAPLGSYAGWWHGTNQLHLFLDGLDECLQHNAQIGAQLEEALCASNLPRERLLLRFCCRTPDWLSLEGLQKTLKATWTATEFQEVELCPLRERDVVDAINDSAKSIDPSQFMQAVRDYAVGPFAALPLTLNELIKRFSRDQQLPASRADLYEGLCLTLCQEHNAWRKSRAVSSTSHLLTPRDKLLVAGRIAALTILTGRSSVNISQEQANSSAIIDEYDLCGGIESLNGVDVAVDLNVIRQALDTALFTGGEQLTLTWTHYSHAEFLAAWYLNCRNLPLDQIRSLLGYASTSQSGPVPQMRAVGAWLAAFRMDVFDDLLEQDSRLFIKGDLSRLSDQQRERVLASLLRSHSMRSLYDNIYEYSNVTQQLRKLSHPRLAMQVQPIVVNKAADIDTRKLALLLLELSGSRELDNDLVKIALDTSEHVDIRIRCAGVIADEAEAMHKLALWPLARGEAGEDPTDALKGCGLLALWPRHITVEELLALLTEPNRPSERNAYFNFLTIHFAEHLSKADLPKVLAWSAPYCIHRHSITRHPFTEAADEIVIKAWSYLDDNVVLDALVPIATMRILNGQELFGADDWIRQQQERTKHLFENVDARRRLLTALVEQIPVERGDTEWYLFSALKVKVEDLPWLLDQLRAASHEFIQARWLYFIRRCMDELRLAILECFEGDPNRFRDRAEAKRKAKNLSKLRTQLLRYLRVVANTGSLMPPIEQQIQVFLRNHRRSINTLLAERKKQRQAAIPIPLHQRKEVKLPSALERLRRIARGGAAVVTWEQFCWVQQLSGEPFGPIRFIGLLPQPPWEELAPKVKACFVESAWKCITAKQNSKVDHSIVSAEFDALLFLQRVAPSKLNTLSKKQWHRVAKVVTRYHYWAQDNELISAWRDVVTRVYQACPDALTAELTRAIGVASQAGSNFPLSELFNEIWNPNLDAIVSSQLDNTSLHIATFSKLVADWFKLNPNKAAEYVKTWLKLSIESECPLDEAKIAYGALHLLHLDPAQWDEVWSALQISEKHAWQFAELNANVYASFYRLDGLKSIEYRLSAQAVGDLWLWLNRHFPPKSDPVHDEPYSPNTRDHITHWRNRVLYELRQRGTNEACIVLRQLSRELPNMAEVRFALAHAEDRYRELSWMPPTPQMVLLIIEDATRRLISSADQLLDVIVEQLQLWAKSLRDDWSLIESLWDMQRAPEKTWEPKDEAAFSNQVAGALRDRLRDRGLIINREAEIKRGNETDIIVSAIVPPRLKSDKAGLRIDVVIECKGCWNRGIDKNALQTQLVKRYLDQGRGSYRHGLFLVGWFHCDAWKSKTQQQFNQLTDTLAQQAQQCVQASSNDTPLDVRSLVLNLGLHGSTPTSNINAKKSGQMAPRSHSKRKDLKQ